MVTPNFAILYVDSPERSGAFYASLLGREPVETSPTFAMFVLDKGFKLGLWSRHTVEPAAAAAGGGGELVLAVENAAAVDATHSDWAKRGLKILQTPTDMDFGRTFVALDPDNHRLRVYWRGSAGMSAYWVAVASAGHVRIGRQAGFMQVNHGKAPPLRRIKPGDGIVYYSPSTVLGEKDGLQSFTAIGTVREGEIYQGEMGGGFKPARRDVDWSDAEEAPIKPLLDRLDFTAGKPNWGYQLRFGLFEISEHDFRLIGGTMGAKPAVSAI